MAPCSKPRKMQLINRNMIFIYSMYFEMYFIEWVVKEKVFGNMKKVEEHNLSLLYY